MRIKMGTLKKIIREAARKTLREGLSPEAEAALVDAGINSGDWDLWEESGDVVLGPYGEEIEIGGSGGVGLRADYASSEDHRRIQGPQRSYRG